MSPRMIVAPIRRAQAMEVALKLFLEYGVTATSLSDIADRLDLTKAALYLYFDGKDDLVLSATTRLCEIIENRMADAAKGSGSPMKRMLTAMRALPESNAKEQTAADEESGLMLELHGLSLRDERISELLAAHREKYTGLVAEVIKQAQAKNEAASGDAMALATAAIALNDGLHLRRLAASKQTTLTDAHAQALKTLLGAK